MGAGLSGDTFSSGWRLLVGGGGGPVVETFGGGPVVGKEETSWTEHLTSGTLHSISSHVNEMINLINLHLNTCSAVVEHKEKEGFKDFL